MAKVYLPTQFVQVRFAQARATLIQLFNEIENGFRQLDDSNISPGGISSVSLADGVGLSASGQYTGNGAVDRTIVLPWSPRYVHVVSHADLIDFFGIGSGTGPFAAWHRTTAGAFTSDGTGNNDWQGVTTNGFLLGHIGTGLSNKNTQLYSYFACR
jgi:hypothetical protein